MMLENKTDEQVKICVYKTSSVLDNIPCEGGMVFLEPFKNGEWSPVPAESRQTFDVRCFHPELIDRLLARHPDVPKGSRVQLSRSGTSYSIAIVAP